MSFYGPPRIKIVRDDIDLVGIRHLEVAQRWQPNGVGLSVQSILSQRPAAPAVANMLIIANSTVYIDGAMETKWTYEGYSDDPSLPFKTYGVSEQWDFDPGFQETSLLFNPNWSTTLQSQYGGMVDADNQITFPAQIAGNTTGTGLGAATDSEQVDNPMYGYQTYFSMATGAWTYRWADTQFKPSFYNDVGQIVSAASIPGSPPDFDALGQGKRNWLKLPPKHRKRGAIIEFVGSWWLSTDSGWPAPAYVKNGGTGSSSNTAL